MIRIFEFLRDGCWHRYMLIDAMPVDHFDVSFGGGDFMYRTLPCRCEKCGRISHVKDRSGQLTYADLKVDQSK